MSDPTPYIGDFYDTLGVPRDATQDEIKKAFRKLARAHHPDVAGDDPEAARQFDRIRKAYDVLGDPEARAKYDRGPEKRATRRGGRWTEQGYRMPGGFYAQQDGQGGSQARSRGGRRRDPANDIGLDDLFADFASSPQSGPTPRPDSRGPARGGPGGNGGRGPSINIDDLASGLPGADFAGGGTWAGPRSGASSGGFGGDMGGMPGGGGGGAPDQRGSYGQRSADGTRTGVPGRDIQMTVDVPANVAAFGGTVTLEYPRMRLTEDGRGLFRYDELHDLRIPPHVRNGATLRVHHMGDDGTDGTYGDLVCELRVAAGEPSRRTAPGPSTDSPRSSPRSAAPESTDESILPISIVEALLGGRVEVDTPSGKVRLTIPPGSSGGGRLRLRGRGANGADHYVTLRIVVPKVLDDESRELIERFAELNPMDPRAD